jgi:hypothetical protein
MARSKGRPVGQRGCKGIGFVLVASDEDVQNSALSVLEKSSLGKGHWFCSLPVDG